MEEKYPFFNLQLNEVHLQWFAAEDEGRTEQPTEHKLRKAREDGKVAKSSEFTSALVLLFGIAVLGLLGSQILKNALDMLRFFLGRSTEIDISRDMGLQAAFMSYFLRLVLPIMLVAFIAALAGNIFQVGFLFSVKPITPDFSKILPRFGKFFKRALFSGEAAFNLGKSIFKVVLIGLISFLNIRAQLPKLVNLIDSPFIFSFSFIAGIAFTIMVEAALALLLLSIPDYYFQRKQHLESLKMSRQEIKEERKMYEGDPLVKSRLRERMREMLQRTMLKTVPQADVVITNPTHYAIAVKYESLVMEAPTVLAKGEDRNAQRIREIALENDVPLVENKPLARALYQEVEVGDAIPAQYYEVMAVILSEVYRINDKSA